MSELLSGYRKGHYWECLQKILKTLNEISLDITGDHERQFEDRIAATLGFLFKNDFIDQRNTKQVITRVTLFGHDHRPDMSVGTDGIAIEVKLAKSGQSFREAIGQSLIYRMGYRFVIVVWIDTTRDKVYNKAFENEEGDEKKFLRLLEDHNIFCVIK